MAHTIPETDVICISVGGVVSETRLCEQFPGIRYFEPEAMGSVADDRFSEDSLKPLFVVYESLKAS